jgi:hypothetical protein
VISHFGAVYGPVSDKSLSVLFIWLIISCFAYLFRCVPQINTCKCPNSINRLARVAVTHWILSPLSGSLRQLVREQFLSLWLKEELAELNIFCWLLGLIFSCVVLDLRSSKS